VRRGLATYLDRCEFIAAFWKEELIGFLKMVYVDHVAILFHIISMNEHYDKRPMNALIAKAVEFCEQKGISHFVYGQFVYGNKHRSSLSEFKRRNGFEQINFPRYYIPLTVKGRVFVRLKLYKGSGGLLPEPILQIVLSFRSRCSKMFSVRGLYNTRNSPV
jgi:glucose-6-phosphate 1-dehydrogenase